MDKPALNKIIGITIQRLRKDRGFSQEAFADACEIHRVYMGKIERGQVAVTIPTLGRVLAGLGMTFVEFFRILESADFPDKAD